ncbi:MAG: RDD family protein [Candidatus Limnocylindria bacterium]
MPDVTGQSGSSGEPGPEPFAPAPPAPSQPSPIPTAWAPPPRPPRPGPAPGVEYAGFWIRAAAYVIDALPFLVIGLVVASSVMGAAFELMRDIPLPPPGSSPNSPEYQAWELAFTQRMTLAMGGFYPWAGLFQLASIVYFVGFWTWRGQTPGMMLFGLRVARDTDGAKPGLARSLLRYVGYVLSWVALFIGFIWVAFDSRKQGWHDKIAGTVVVRQAG